MPSGFNYLDSIHSSAPYHSTVSPASFVQSEDTAPSGPAEQQPPSTEQVMSSDEWRRTSHSTSQFDDDAPPPMDELAPPMDSNEAEKAVRQENLKSLLAEADELTEAASAAAAVDRTSVGVTENEKLAQEVTSASHDHKHKHKHKHKRDTHRAVQEAAEAEEEAARTLGMLTAASDR